VWRAGAIRIPQHKREALETGLIYLTAGRVTPDTAAEVCKDVRRQAARMLGLMDEDLVRGKVDPKKEEDQKRLEDTIRRSLRGKYHVVYEKLSETDPKSAGTIRSQRSRCVCQANPIPAPLPARFHPGAPTAFPRLHVQRARCRRYCSSPGRVCLLVYGVGFF
jgi:hypothetical protein